MDLVEHLTVRRDALPVAVLPAVGRGIDEDGPAVRPVNLGSGGRVGEWRAAIESITHSGRRHQLRARWPRTNRRPPERARFRVRRSGPVRPTRPFGPDPEAGAVAGNFCAVGIPASRWAERCHRGRSLRSESAVSSVVPDNVQPDEPARVPKRHGTSSARDCCPGRSRSKPSHDRSPAPMTPRATYRIQFGPSFGFGEAAGLAPYLSALGVSHVYAAPVFAARPGSSHGYDVVDPTRLNPELGGEAGFRAMAAAFRRQASGSSSTSSPTTWGSAATATATGSTCSLGTAEPLRALVRYRLEPRRTRASRGKVLAPFLGESYRKALDGGRARAPVRSDRGRLRGLGARHAQASGLAEELRTASCAPGVSTRLQLRRRP